MKYQLTAALFALVLATGCDQKLMPEPPVVYAPWEEGLTLGYENPNLPAKRREEERFQVRVTSSRPVPGARVVVQTITTLTGQSEARSFQQDGGVSLGPNGEGDLSLLPKGFPNRTDRWEARGQFHWVVGRTCVRMPGVPVAGPTEAQGVWVETVPVSGEGARTRTLYAPGLGEVATARWEGGRWVPGFRLVSRGFTDVPVLRGTK